MSKSGLASGTVHQMSKDLSDTLLADKNAMSVWQDITPLARNEFICWVESAKRTETRKKRIQRLVEELNEGKRRPCCWAGCNHRT